MVRRALWEQLGGFDEHFVPAYYEDTVCARHPTPWLQGDLPTRAVVTHFEGVSHGTDTGAGMKAHQVTNQKRFAEKWQSVLIQHQTALSP